MQYRLPPMLKYWVQGLPFPYPLYSKMFDQYHTKTGVKVNYQSIGSGGGIKQLQEKTVDFGASDAPMNDEQLSKSPAPIVHIPICIGRRGGYLQHPGRYRRH